MRNLSPAVLERIRAGLKQFERREAVRADVAKNPPIAVGERRPFYSTAVGRPNDKPRLCHYTGETVTVVGLAWWYASPGFDPKEDETVYTVQADDGSQFDAFAGELNGWYERTGQYVLPDGTYYQPVAS